MPMQRRPDPRRALAALLLASCASLPPQLRAADRWHKATGLLPDYSRLTYVPAESFVCGQEPKAVGCYLQGEIKVAAFAPCDAELILVHEGGHALGAGHVLPGEGAMAPSMHDARPCLTAKDLDSVCKNAPCVWRRPECP
jgi:hypothetical protein